MLPPFEQTDFFQSLAPGPRKRTFLGWGRPLVEAAADDLATRHRGDLGDTLVVVPTAQAARRLSGALWARQAPAPASISTPDVLYAPPDGTTPRPATHGELLLAWALTLRELPLRKLRHLFPADPQNRDFAWASATAASLLKLRNTLGEGALMMRDVAPLLADASRPDAPRWRDLAAIEDAAADRLQAADLADPALLAQQFAGEPRLPPGVERIALIAVPDPPAIAVKALEALAPTRAVSVAIFAPEQMAERFDPWGRPRAAAWKNAEIDIADSAIELTAAPPEQAAAVARFVAEHGADQVALAIADPDLAAPIASALAAREIPSHQPGGRPLSGGAEFALVRLVADLLESRSFAHAAELARHPGILREACLQTPHGSRAGAEPTTATPPPSPADLLADLDGLGADHLPATLADARFFADRWRRHAASSTLLRHIGQWLERLETEPLDESVLAFLDAHHNDPGPPGAATGAEGDAARGDDGEAAPGASPFAQKLAGQLRATRPFGTDWLTEAEALRLALDVLADEAEPEPRPGGAIELNGWLEALWSPEAAIAIAGANDGHLPESFGGDPFLPNAARRKLGLRDSDSRLVRDSYLLAAIAAGRRDSLRIFLARTGDDGSPRRPSRLLFRCPDRALPARALLLCSAGASPPPTPAWQAAWQLTPPPPPPGSHVFERISVTAFSSYLDCPFRFYLKHALAMEEFDPGKMEMDPRDFGTLCHDALEDFGNDPAIRDSTDADAISEYLLERLEKRAFARFGRRLSVPLAFQLESAKQRLDWAAKIQAAERAAGWQIVDTEWEIHGDGRAWHIGGLQLRGTIDRIERHESGAWRILDYKTSAKATPPEAAHLSALKRPDAEPAPPAWAVLASGPKTRRWTNLQLPLYVLALGALRDAGRPAAGYFNLATSHGETKIELWEDLDPATLDSAHACAEGVAAAVQAHQYWPPSANPRYDDFSRLLFGAPELHSLPPAPPARR